MFQHRITKLDQLIKLAQGKPYDRVEQYFRKQYLEKNIDPNLQKEYDQRASLRNTIANLIERRWYKMVPYGLSGAGSVLGSVLGHTLTNKDTTSQLLGILGGGVAGGLAGYGSSQLLPKDWSTDLANLIGIQPNGNVSLAPEE